MCVCVLNEESLPSKSTYVQHEDPYNMFSITDYHMRIHISQFSDVLFHSVKVDSFVSAQRVFKNHFQGGQTSVSRNIRGVGWS